jgi:hypothetical protein
MERAVGTFAVVFAVFYAFAFHYNLTMFTYYPAINLVVWGAAGGGPDIGPPMFWYGWIVNGMLLGTAAGILALALPPRATEKIWPVVVWAVPLGAMLYMTWAGRHWFTFQIENLPH